MNRAIKEAILEPFHYDHHDQLRHHLQDFITAYNFGRRLKTLKGLTPSNTSANAGQTSPNASDLTNPSNAGLNT